MRLFVVIAMLSVTAALAHAQRPEAGQRLADLEAEATRDSLDPDALYRLALGYARAGRWDDEGRALHAALVINPRYAPAYIALSFEPFQRRPGLQREIRKRKVPPDWRDSLVETNRLLHLAFIIDPLAELTPPDVDSGQGQRALASLNFLLALRFNGRPLGLVPAWVLWYRGLTEGRSGQFDPAIADIRELLRRGEAVESDSLAPFPVGTNEYRYVLAVLYERAGKPADALSFFQQTLAGDLGNYMAHVRLAHLYRDHQMWNDAVAEAQRAVETNPEDPTTARELGEILLAAGRLAEAEAAVRDAQARNPRDLGTEYVLGVIFAQSHRGEDARAALGRFVSLAPPALYGPQIKDARQRLAALDRPDGDSRQQ